MACPRSHVKLQSSHSNLNLSDYKAKVLSFSRCECKRSPLLYLFQSSPLACSLLQLVKFSPIHFPPGRVILQVVLVSTSIWYCIHLTLSYHYMHGLFLIIFTDFPNQNHFSMLHNRKFKILFYSRIYEYST